MEPIENKPLYIDGESSDLTLTTNMLTYNFKTIGDPTIKKFSEDDNDKYYNFGYRITNASTSHKAFGFSNIHYNLTDIVITGKMNHLSESSDGTELEKALRQTKYSIVLRGANQNYSQYITVEIPIHNLEDVSGSYNTSDTASLGSQIVQNLAEDIHNNSTELDDGNTINSKMSIPLNPNDLIPDCQFYSYLYKEYASELYTCIFIDPIHSPIVLHSTNYNKFITAMKDLEYTAQSDLETRVAFNQIPMRKVTDVTKTNNLSPEIYIDCSPSNDANSGNAIQYISKPFSSENMKESVDKFITIIMNILIVFVVVYFLYFKLPGMINTNDVSNPSAI
jgi:hypothetical protein